MRTIPLEHFRRLVPGVPPVYPPGNDHLQTVACQNALRHAYTHSHVEETERISLSIPGPLIRGLLEGNRLAACVSDTITLARRTDLMDKSRPKKYPTRGRQALSVTLSKCTVASMKLIAHACDVSIGDVAAWALEIGRKE